MPSFNDLNLKPALLHALQEIGFTTPTPIQAAAIPVLLNGKDVAGQAETGSGKTAAFGLAILQSINPEVQQVQALILVPTRELAVQVRQELKQLARQLPTLKISAFYGGHSFSQERASLAHPPHILVGTPGRLTDHLSRQTLDLSFTKQLVLDEADKLLEMGFEEEIDRIVDSLPQKRQNILFSATMPDVVKKLISNSLNNPVFVQASVNAIPEQVKLIGLKLEQNDRQESLVKLLQSINYAGTVIFCNTRVASDSLTTFLQERGFAVKALHGGMEQSDRDKTMTLFRNGTTQVLVATDLAARGLDIAALKTIIHYELPDDVAAFMHRSGRTGRAGKSGVVYTLVSSRDENKLLEWSEVQMDEWITPSSLAKATARATVEETSEFATLHINGGRKDKISPRDIVGALIAEAGINASQIGKIEIHDRSSYVAVPANLSKTILEKLSQGKIKGRRYKIHLVK